MLIWPILFVKIHVVCFFVCSAQSFRVLCAQAGIRIPLGSGNRSVPKLNFVKPFVLFSQQIDEFHVSHPQETKRPLGRHKARQQARLLPSSSLTIRLSVKHAAAWRRATLKQCLMERDSLSQRECVCG